MVCFCISRHYPLTLMRLIHSIVILNSKLIWMFHIFGDWIVCLFYSSQWDGIGLFYLVARLKCRCNFNAKTVKCMQHMNGANVHTTTKYKLCHVAMAPILNEAINSFFSNILSKSWCCCFFVVLLCAFVWRFEYLLSFLSRWLVNFHRRFLLKKKFSNLCISCFMYSFPCTRLSQRYNNCCHFSPF